MLTNLNRPTGLATGRRTGETIYAAVVHRDCAYDTDGYDACGANFCVEDLPRDGRRLTCEICGEGRSITDYGREPR